MSGRQTKRLRLSEDPTAWSSLSQMMYASRIADQCHQQAQRIRLLETTLRTRNAENTALQDQIDGLARKNHTLRESFGQARQTLRTLRDELTETRNEVQLLSQTVSRIGMRKRYWKKLYEAFVRTANEAIAERTVAQLDITPAQVAQYKALAKAQQEAAAADAAAQDAAAKASAAAAAVRQGDATSEQEAIDVD